MYQEGGTSDERISALKTIGYSDDPKIIQNVLAAIIDGKSIQNQDVYIPISGIRSTRNGCDAAWHHFLDNWDQYSKRFPPGLSLLRSLVRHFCEGMGTLEQLSTFKAFFADKNTEGYDSSVRHVIDVVQARISWTERDSADIIAWFKTNGYIS